MTTKANDNSGDAGNTKVVASSAAGHVHEEVKTTKVDRTEDRGLQGSNADIVEGAIKHGNTQAVKEGVSTSVGAERAVGGKTVTTTVVDKTGA